MLETAVFQYNGMAFSFFTKHIGLEFHSRCQNMSIQKDVPLSVRYVVRCTLLRAQYSDRSLFDRIL